MKNIALLVMLFCAGGLFISQKNIVYSQETAVNADTIVISGVVDFVDPENLGKGRRAEIYIIDESGRKIKFLVDFEAVISNKGGENITAREINKGDRVAINYTVNKEGTNIAKSVKVVE
ncbi:MAG: hypothetical protein HZC15_06970 [Candidatus Omnitrophica bacterium]|nr:hypothetical protein [Candidatus Omnitrophota bacterium]